MRNRSEQEIFSSSLAQTRGVVPRTARSRLSSAVSVPGSTGQVSSIFIEVPADPDPRLSVHEGGRGGDWLIAIDCPHSVSINRVVILRAREEMSRVGAMSAMDRRDFEAGVLTVISVVDEAMAALAGTDVDHSVCAEAPASLRWVSVTRQTI